MIRVTVELLSAVDEKRSKVLGVMEIANDGTGSNTVCDYDGRVLRAPDFKATTRAGQVKGHRRLSLTIWHLVGKMLMNMGYAK